MPFDGKSLFCSASTAYAADAQVARVIVGAVSCTALGPGTFGSAL